MLRKLLRPWRRGVPTALVTCLVIAACATSPGAKSSNKLPGSHLPTLPANARIVRSVDVSLPAVSNPSSTLPGANQRDIAFIDARTGFLATGGQEIATDQGGVYNAVSGGIQRTIDGGKTWQTVWTAPGANISTVTFLSPSIGFAAGQVFPTSSTTSASGQPIWLRSTNGGASWSVTTPQLPTAGAGAWPSLRFVTTTPNLILAATDSNQNDGYLSTMLRSADGGNHWSQVGPSGWIPTGGLAFATPSLAFATGYLRDITAPTVSSKLWRSRDSGQTWSAVPGTQLPFGLNAIDFPDPVHGFAAGGNLAKYEMRPSRGVLATNDGGRTWLMRYQSPDSDVTNPITRLRFLDANHGWASIGACSEGQNGPCGGAVQITADGGRSWHTTDRTAVDISAVSPNEAWVIDFFRAEFAWHTIDGGATWWPVVRAGALSIESLSGTRGWLVATTAAGAWQSHDGGGTWTPLDQASLGPADKLGDANLLVQPPGLLVLQQDPGLWISHDAGAHTFDVTLPGQDASGASQLAVAFADSSHGMAIVGAQNCVKPPGYAGSTNGKPPVGVPQGSASVDVSADGGTTWTARTMLDVLPWGAGAAPEFWAITGTKGCSGPGPVVMISRDDARFWSTQRLPAQCFAISVAAPGTIWLNCVDSLLMTRDGALTWTRYRFTQGVPSVLAIGRDEALAYGPTGALWRTTDGGLTWKVVPVSF